MFRVEELLPDKGSAPAPGYTYVADRSFKTPQARAPALSRKRGIRDAGKGGDISSRRANAIAKHIAELDRENKRDVAIPIPAKQPSKSRARKTTSNTRRILQSQKTFRNHLDDEEAAINNAAAGVSTPSGNTGLALNRGNKALAVSAARRSSTPATPAPRDGKKRGGVAVSTPTPAPSAATPATTGTDVAMEDEDEERKHKLLKTEHDDDPLLRSYGPVMPSERVLQKLLAEPPLSYNAARSAPPGPSRLPRHFCCVCGYWGKIPCKSCHARTCGLDCYRMHEDSRCGAFY